MPANILVVEDEPAIQELIAVNLEHAGHHVIRARDAEGALGIVRNALPDLLLIDWMLPGMSGVALARQMRQEERTKAIPIILLTARGAEADKVSGLEAGADDYVTKPFSIGELIARVKAMFRRLNRLSSHEETIQIGPSEVNVKKHQVTRGRKTQPMTFYEIEVLKLLHERADQAVSRDEILDKIWGIQGNPTNRTVDNFIVKLRRKLEDDHKKPRHILTVYGHGYKLVP